MSAVVLWFLLIQQERYLQAVLPWMAAGTAACLIRIWELGWIVRAATVPLLGLQLVWGGDIPFFRTHNEIFDSPIRRVAEFLASGFERVPNRFDVFEPMTSIGKTMPHGSIVMAHAMNRTLGIDRESLLDACQTRFSYGRLRTAAAIHGELKSLGVTHLVWPDRIPPVDSMASELSFLNYAIGHGSDVRKMGGYNVARVPIEDPRENEIDYRVAVFACGNPYRQGWYRLSQLTLPVLNPGAPPAPDRTLDDPTVSSKDADMIVVDTACHADVAPAAPFVLGAEQGTNRFYVLPLGASR
jgi:hypothetical protein